MPAYTAAEYTEMIMLYAELNHSAHAAAAEFRRRNPGRRPNHNTVLRAVQRARENGNVMPNNRREGAPRRARTAENELRIINYVINHPECSIRDMVAILNLSYWTIQQTLRDYG